MSSWNLLGIFHLRAVLPLRPDGVGAVAAVDDVAHLLDPDQKASGRRLSGLRKKGAAMRRRRRG
jgi:hypothetical protein